MLAIAVATLCGGALPAAAQAPTTSPTSAPAAPTASELAPTAQEISVVTVLGRLPQKRKPTQNVRRLDRRSASSCAFDSSASGLAMIDSYMDSFYGRDRVNDGTEAEIVQEGDTKQNQGFSDTSPNGDASRDGPELGKEDSATGRSPDCKNADLLAAAGRNSIARRDKSIDKAYTAYEKGEFASAMELFKTSYKKVGWDEAALMIGNMYFHGEGVKQDFHEAAAWYTKLAQARKTDHQMSPYDPKDPERASARAEAQVRLANMYMAGQGVSKDPAAARKWYQEAEELNLIPARYALGRFMLTGYGGSKDVERGRKLLTNAAEYGYAPAQWMLARLYDDGTVIARDPAHALAWYQQAAFNPKAGERKPHAELALARMYDTGNGVKADPVKAIRFYKSAAVSGHPVAQNALATYFYEGNQVGKDLAIARKLFIAAASQGNSEAMVNAGVMLFKGEGGTADPVQSYVWLKLAEQMGNTQAPPMVKLVEKRLDATQRSQAEAVLKPKAKS